MSAVCFMSGTQTLCTALPTDGMLTQINLNSMPFGGRVGEYFVPSRRQNSLVGTETRVGAVSIPGRIQGFFSVPQAPRQTVEPFQPSNNRYLKLKYPRH